MKLYNTMTRKKEELSTLKPNQIKMYTCGQTVYNDIHMGNARFYVVFDAIRRYLRWRGYDVNFVQNFTDIDDKIIQKASEEGCTTEEIAERYIAHTLEDLASLNCLPATVNPRATQEVPEIITLISQLVEKGFAYENCGTVYYDVKKFANYGKLSKKKIEDLEAGARVEIETGKRDPMDFVLWKPAKPGEPQWESPWGGGRPGWHIECSAMAKKYLGDEIDIHGGAEDLIFPHHENEIAQTEAVTGKEFARCWLHCGILTTDHKKMSKSRGNFFTLREMAEKFPHDVIRFYLLSGHYRMPMEFNDEVLKAAAAGLQRIKTSYENLRHLAGISDDKPMYDLEIKYSHKWGERSRQDFTDAMNDDFNTANAITSIFNLVRDIIREINIVKLEYDGNCSRAFYDTLMRLIKAPCDILGIKIGTEDDTISSEIEALIAARQEARAAKNFAESDRIRDELLSMGIILEDTPSGARWRRA